MQAALPLGPSDPEDLMALEVSLGPDDPDLMVLEVSVAKREAVWSH